MADEHGIDAVLDEKLLLEGQQAKHAVNGFSNRLDPARAPRPDGRADVVDSRDSRRTQARLDAQVEIRRVDTDKHVRRVVLPAVDERPAQTQQARNVPQRFDEAHDGQFLGVGPVIAAGLKHRRSGDALELRVGV